MRGFISKNTALRQNFTEEYLMLDKKTLQKELCSGKIPADLEEVTQRQLKLRKSFT